MTDRETMEGLEPAGLTAGGLFAKCRQYLDNLRVEMDADDPREAEVIGATRTLTEILDRFTSLREQLEEVEEERDRWRAEFDKASDNLAAVCEELGDARRRAEEAEEDAARYADSNMKLNAGYNRLARRADQLEEAVKHVVEELDHEIGERDLPDSALWWLGELRDRLRSALDSREDEGEEADRYCEKCRSTGWRVVEDEAGPPHEPPVITVKACSYCNPWGDDPSLNAGIPVHADEPVSREGEDDCLMGTPAEIDGCYRLLGSGELKTISDCPVHADEPEGDGEHSEGGRG